MNWKNKSCNREYETSVMKKKTTFPMKIGDYCILFIIFLVLVFFLQGVRKMNQGNQVCVTVRGNTVCYDLTKDQKISLKDFNVSERDEQIANMLVIEDGQVYMESADCPDQICVKHKPVSKDGEIIVCLPNEVFVEIKSSMESDIDN